MATSSEKDFFEAVKDSLEERGVLDKLSAEIRSHVLQILKSEDQGQGTENKDIFKTSENFLINELIKEYLEWNKLKHTQAVLVAETGHPKESLTRRELEESLHVKTGPNAQQVPLLYTLVSALINKSN